MAQHVSAPTDGPQKLNKEQASLIQAEKQKDNDTRAHLEKLYGAAQGPRLRRVHLTRFANKAWKCPHCGASSRDIRHVCGSCLQPEPESLSRQRPYKEPAARRRPAGQAESAPAAQPPLPPPQWLEATGPTQTRDHGVQLIRVATTQRVYRQWNDPVAPAPKASKSKGHDGTAHYDPNDDDVDEEEEELEAAARQDRVYEDAPEGCAPGARFREMADPRRGDEIDEGQDADDGPVGVIGDARPAGNPHSSETQKRVMPEKPFTHFVSLPIGKLPSAQPSCARLMAQLRGFVETSHADGEDATTTTESATAVTAAPAVAGGGAAAAPSPAAGLTEEMISPVSKLHLTMLMLTLSTPEDVAFAVELLQHFKKIWDDTKSKLRQLKAAGTAVETAAEATSDAAKMALSPNAPYRPLVSLGDGLRVMPTDKSNENVNPKKASVVYMELRDEASLAAVTTIQDLIHTCLSEVITRPDEAERSKQLLHMTVVNKKWRRKAAKRPFDATELLAAFQDAAIGAGESNAPFELGTVELNRLSGGKRDEGYFVEASIEL